MFLYNKWFPVILLWIEAINCMSLMNQQQHSYFMDTSGNGPESDVADLMISKGYLPNDNDLPKTSIVKNVDNDITYLLSKLSDEELLKLLNDQPKKNAYDLNDIVKVAVDGKSGQDAKADIEQTKSHEIRDNIFVNSNLKNNRFQQVNEKGQEKVEAYFRLENKPVDPYKTKSEVDPNYTALQKINNLLYSRPIEEEQDSEEDDEKKELLFDVLVAQLKTLCCKKSKISKHTKLPYKSLLNEIAVQKSLYSKTTGTESKPPQSMLDIPANEYMFLIINDEIKGNGSDDLISVDPESLDKNSSVLLLGPITTPLTNSQLKAVMTRISNELSKSDYMPLLQQISEGKLSGSNIRLTKSLVTGPETRRYIKPHRCNHQSPLARVYGGPKWIICTGYLNLNQPSLYDRK
ncbi:hypothetical protein O0L34_g12604 [Tuta absoluta]|nr:hypothetical protein O0L34_g12604 [Tuta absoluta]